MNDFGGGEFSHPTPSVDAELLARAKKDEMRRQRGGDHRPPKGPRGPRFGLLRRVVRVIRGGGD